MTAVKVALIVGSNRRDSLNRRLAFALEAMLKPKVDCSWVRIDDLPMFNQDLEQDPPSTVVRFKREVAQANAILFVTPEHNRSIPAVLKNAIDWGARPRAESCWNGKIAAIIGTSPGALGTAIAQSHLRQMLNAIGVISVSGEVYITYKPDLLDEQGVVSNADTRQFLQNYTDSLVDLLSRLRPSN